MHKTGKNHYFAIMTNFIPVFPLAIVVYPGEPLNLHIFEPRYIQMAEECIREQKAFGILPVLNGKTSEYGTLVDITEMAKKYKDGTMDIRTRGSRVFRVLEFIKTIPDKLFSGAIVSYPANENITISKSLSELIISEVSRLYHLLNEESRLPPEYKEWNAYNIAHKVGLTLEQEYELLCIFNEMQRLEYLRRHLNTMQPIIEELEQLKARIKMNGHFRNLSSPEL